MVKDTIKDKMTLQAFPEEITKEGLRIYGETSYENQMAVLSHYLHNKYEEIDGRQQFPLYQIFENIPTS